MKTLIRRSPISSSRNSIAPKYAIVIPYHLSIPVEAQLPSPIINQQLVFYYFVLLSMSDYTVFLSIEQKLTIIHRSTVAGAY